MKDKSKDLKTFAQELFEKLGFDDVQIEVEKEDDRIVINVEGEDLGAIIGHHGDTLNSLQHIFSLVATQKLGELTHVTLDAGGWRKNREEQLEQMAEHAIAKVRQSGKPYEFPPMPPSERRIIHMALGEASDITSESEGEEANRHIVFKPA